MPPHCDSWDGPVVQAALRALRERSVELVLPYVAEESEAEVRADYEKTVAQLGDQEPGQGNLPTEWFCENVVRLHRQHEGAAFTGLKPAGLGHGEAVPLAEAAIASGDPQQVAKLLTGALEHELQEKFGRVMWLQGKRDGTVAVEREYVEAMLGFQVWSHKTHECIRSGLQHGHAHAHEE